LVPKQYSRRVVWTYTFPFHTAGAPRQLPASWIRANSSPSASPGLMIQNEPLFIGTYSLPSAYVGEAWIWSDPSFIDHSFLPVFASTDHSSPVAVTWYTRSPTRIGELVNISRSLRQTSASLPSTGAPPAVASGGPGSASARTANIRPIFELSRFCTPWISIT
jgi:hypothetical protein